MRQANRQAGGQAGRHLTSLIIFQVQRGPIETADSVCELRSNFRLGAA